MYVFLEAVRSSDVFWKADIHSICVYASMYIQAQLLYYTGQVPVRKHKVKKAGIV